MQPFEDSEKTFLSSYHVILITSLGCRNMLQGEKQYFLKRAYSYFRDAA